MCITIVVKQLMANTELSVVQERWLSTVSLLANVSRNKVIKATLNNMLMDSKQMLRLMIYGLPKETSLGIRNSLLTMSSLISTQKAMMMPMPAINSHLIHPKLARPKGRNTTKKRMAISALRSRSLIMVVFIRYAKVVLILQ